MAEQPSHGQTKPTLADLFETLGVPVPRPLSAEEKAAFDREQDEVDARIKRRQKRRAA